MPVLAPADPQDVLDLGLHGIALSRFCGLWTGFKRATNVVDGAASVRVGLDRLGLVVPDRSVGGADFVHEVSAQFLQPNLGRLESSLMNERLELARWYAAANHLLDRRRALTGGGLTGGSAGRPAEQPLDGAAVALGRAARAAVADGHRHDRLARRRGRAVVGVARGGAGGTDPLADHPDHGHDALAALLAEPHLIAGPDQVRGLDPHPVDPDVPGPAGSGTGRAGLDQPDRPDPAVHPPRLIVCHPATVMRPAASPARPAHSPRGRRGGRLGP